MSEKENKTILKQQRVMEIMEAARLLNKSCPFSDITLTDIARSARFTRSNLYKYFSCREDLFLELLKEELTQWLKDINSTFSKRRFNVKEFSYIWVDLLIKREPMIELYSLVYSQLEKKATPFALDLWNETFALVMDRTVAILLTVFPAADKEDLKEFFYTQLAQAVGLIPLLFLGKEQMAAKKKHKLVYHSIYYREILSNAVESLLVPWV